MLVPRAACVRDSVPLSVSGDMVTCRHSAPTTRDMGSRVAEGAESGCPVGTLASYYLTYAGGGHSHPLRVRKSPETRRSWRGGNLKVRRPLAEEQAELRHAARQQAQMPVHGVVAPTHLLLAQAPDRSVPGVPATHSTRGGVWSSLAPPALLRTRPTSFAAHRRRQSVLAALFPGLRAMRGGRTPAASCVLCAPVDTARAPRGVAPAGERPDARDLGPRLHSHPNDPTLPSALFQALRARWGGRTPAAACVRRPRPHTACPPGGG